MKNDFFQTEGAVKKPMAELERAEALSIINRARRRVRREGCLPEGQASRFATGKTKSKISVCRRRGGFCGGKSHFPEQKSLPCSFCARKSERFQQKLVGVCLHSYNDTVSANTGVIIERCFRGFPPLEGVQILSSVPSLLCDALRCHPAWITFHGQYTFCSPKRYPTYHSRVSTWCFSKSYQVSI